MIAEGLPVYRPERLTHSHQFALEAAPFGGGQAASKHLRRAGFLASGIGLPLPEVPGDANGIRLGTPELVRWGMTEADAPRLADLIAARALRSDTPEALAPDGSPNGGSTFDRVHFVHEFTAENASGSTSPRRRATSGT
jgi:glycine hydroxymethyltransferase